MICFKPLNALSDSSVPYCPENEGLSYCFQKRDFYANLLHYFTRKPVPVNCARKTEGKFIFLYHDQKLLGRLLMLLGYTRISKADGGQTLDLQHDVLIAAGIKENHIYEDKMSGRHDKRPGLDSCLKALRHGDTLVVWKLDRLGRNLRHLIELIERLSADNIGLKVLTGQGAAIDTTRPEGKLVFGIFAALAEFERELIVERTRAGLTAARARGRIGGRPRKMTPSKIRMAMAAMSDPNAKAHLVAQELGITTTTLYDYINGDGTPKNTAQKVLDSSFNES